MIAACADVHSSAQRVPESAKHTTLVSHLYRDSKSEQHMDTEIKAVDKAQVAKTF